MIAEPAVPSPETDAKRWSEWPGYRLVSYGTAGLPVFRLTLTTVAIERRSLDAIREFLMRSIDMGLESESEVSGFLGLSADLVSSEIAGLLQDGLVASTPSTSSPDPVWRLTSKAREVLARKFLSRPREMTIYSSFDGLLRVPRAIRPSELLRAKDLRAMGVPELGSKIWKRPEPEEIDPILLESVEASASRWSQDEIAPTILRINSIDRAERLYREATILVFRSVDSQDLRLRVVIDGRSSDEHAFKLQEAGVLEKSPWFQQLGTREGPPSDLEQLLAPEVQKAIQEATTGAPPSATPLPTSEAADAGSVAPSPAPPGRPIATYEHPELLRYGLLESKRRLLIISPWIRRSVVDRSFLSLIESCLRRGVEVTIGYGFGEDRDEQPPDRDARIALEDLRGRGLRLHRLGNTHAKILLVDDEFFVISSFNWLSFRGDQDRAFREEWGYQVLGAHQVEEFYRQLFSRFVGGA